MNMNSQNSKSKGIQKSVRIEHRDLSVKSPKIKAGIYNPSKSRKGPECYITRQSESEFDIFELKK